MAVPPINVNIQNTSATGGSRLFAGIQIQGDVVTGQASLRDRVITWLDPVDPYATQDRLRNERTPETGEAFLRGPYKRWLESKSRFLWLHGEGGSGKTFLSSLLVDRTPGILAKSSGTDPSKHTVAFFYCQFQDINTQVAIEFLKSVTAQLFIKYGRFKELTDLYTKTQPFRPPQNELLTTLVAVATYPSPEVPGQLLDVESEEQKQSSHTITIIIDGLDEVPIRNRDQYFLIFDTVAKLKAPQFRMVVVSRFQTPIKNRFTETSGWTSTSRTPQDVEADIELYNRQQISRDKCLRDLSDPIKQSIRDRLGQGKPGMFRLAALQMQELSSITQDYDTADELNVEIVYNALDHLPWELDKFYDRIVRNISESVRKPVVAALQWITFAFRPLFVDEVLAACTIVQNRSGYPSIGKQAVDAKIILEHLRGMVELQPSTSGPSVYQPEKPVYQRRKRDAFQLVHQTVREYLFPTFDTDRPAEQGGNRFLRFEADVAHKYLTQCCLFYLSHCARQQNGRSATFPLRCYAWQAWPMHFTAWTDPEATSARPTLESMRLQNSIIYPDLYNGEFFQERAETIVRLDDFLHFLDQPAQKAVRAAIQDPSFPCNVPEEHWSWDTLWSSSADLPKLFRLAILHPAENPETSIKCSLINESLVNFPVYEALSWVWGMSDLVDIQVNGCEFPIPTTLLHSLRALRRKTEHRIVWIDSLTIDMKNWTERGQQVAMMAEIYGSARNTILYMGDGDPDTSLAIEGICRRDKSMITEAINDSGAFTRGIRNIIGRQIWRRTWIIQEVVVAKDSVCSCGMHEIHWTDLSEALEDYGQQLFFKAREWQSVPDDLQELFQSWQAFRSFASISKRWVSKNLLLPELLHLTRFHRTSLRCDMLFGLCSLLQPEEAENPLLAVNYTLSEAEVFTRLATYIITKYRNLDILSFSGFNYSLDPRETSPDWPSWVAMNFVADTFSPGIFDPQQPKIYNAGGRQLREFDISIDSMRLSVEGILIDSIAHVIPLLVPEVSNEKSGTSETGEPVFQRNDIDMKCILDNLHSPEDIADVCYRTKYADVYIDAEGMPKRMPARLEETVGARGVKWPKQKLKKQAIIVTETGKIGVASCHVQRGNQVVVLFGAMTPFIIKQREPRVEAQIQANTYWLVGECYIHGIMDSETVRAHDAGECTSQMYCFA